MRECILSQPDFKTEWHKADGDVVQTTSDEETHGGRSDSTGTSRRVGLLAILTALQKYRDPRFGEATGEYSADHFLHNYDFLSQTRQEELGTIRDSLSRARRLLASSPVTLRAERQTEVDVSWSWF